VSERWIIVDTKATNEEDECGIDWRYLGRNGWRTTIAAAGTFATRDAANDEAHAEGVFGEPHIRIRRVRPAGARRARAAAQGAEDNIATMRAELDGLRATDAEMASRVAMAEQQASGWATAYHSASEREERVRRALGAGQDETTDDAARRVAGERDEACRDLAELRRAIEVLIAQARA